MKATLTRPRELGHSELECWRRLRKSNPLLVSPFFAPEFTLAAAAERAETFVAVIEDGGQIVGFLPLERTGGHYSRPVGGPLSDYHGPIAEPATQIDPCQVLRDAGLSGWHFDHLVQLDGAWRDPITTFSTSPFVDLTGGFDAYLQERRAAGTSIIKKTQGLERRLERECGELRFHFHHTDAAAFETLLRWKSDQYRRTGVIDIFQFPWTGSLLRRLLQSPSDDLQVVFAGLYHDETPLALHYFLRSADVLHSWFLAYDVAWSRYSCGNILTLRVLQRCASEGVTRYDFGKGTERYKQSFATGETPLGEGAVECSAVRRRLRSAWQQSKAMIKATPLRRVVSVPGKILYQFQHRRIFHER